MTSDFLSVRAFHPFGIPLSSHRPNIPQLGLRVQENSVPVQPEIGAVIGVSGGQFFRPAGFKKVRRRADSLFVLF